MDNYKEYWQSDEAKELKQSIRNARKPYRADEEGPYTYWHSKVTLRTKYSGSSDEGTRTNDDIHDSPREASPFLQEEHVYDGATVGSRGEKAAASSLSTGHGHHSSARTHHGDKLYDGGTAGSRGENAIEGGRLVDSRMKRRKVNIQQSSRSVGRTFRLPSAARKMILEDYKAYWNSHEAKARRQSIKDSAKRELAEKPMPDYTYWRSTVTLRSQLPGSSDEENLVEPVEVAPTNRTIDDAPLDGPGHASDTAKLFEHTPDNDKKNVSVPSAGDVADQNVENAHDVSRAGDAATPTLRATTSSVATAANEEHGDQATNGRPGILKRHPAVQPSLRPPKLDSILRKKGDGGAITKAPENDTKKRKVTFQEPLLSPKKPKQAQTPSTRVEKSTARARELLRSLWPNSSMPLLLQTSTSEDWEQAIRDHKGYPQANILAEDLERMVRAKHPLAKYLTLRTGRTHRYEGRGLPCPPGKPPRRTMPNYPNGTHVHPLDAEDNAKIARLKRAVNRNYRARW